MRVGVIGGGLCGLTAAIRLAQRGIDVELFEAAPSPGGRTRSFFEPHTRQWVDNGPHLLSGAYHETHALLAEAGAADNIAWQTSLSLPLWDRVRGPFMLRPNASLPLALALPMACARLPGHGWADIPAFLRLALRLNRTADTMESVHGWLKEAGTPAPLIRDLLEPLCLGAMNETLTGANAASFCSVLRSAFADHASARLGWFRMPLNEALIEPLTRIAQELGVRLHTSARVRGVHPCSSGFEIETSREKCRFNACILALPLHAAQQLLARPKTAVTRRITNVHMWFRGMPALSHPFIGGIGTLGQWFFDVSSQMCAPGTDARKDLPLRHICAVISADNAALQGHELEQRICAELAEISTAHVPPKPQHVRIISEHRATTSVACSETENRLPPSLPHGLIDACESPRSGDLPATIESAVSRGNRAARLCYLQLFR